MTNQKSSYASPLPPLSEKEFPSLGKSTEPKNLEALAFKRYLVIKDKIQVNNENEDQNIDQNKDQNEQPNGTQTSKKKIEKVSDLSVFSVDRFFQKVLGKNYKWCKITRLRSGLLLIEVV